MKQIIILFFWLSVALSAPVDSEDNANALNNIDEKVEEIGSANSPEKRQAEAADTRDAGKVNYEIELDDGKITYNSDLNDLSYSYRLETADGTVKHETAHFEDDSLVAEGGYEYVGDNGIKYSVTYVADKDGYRPKITFGTGASGGSARAPKSIESRSSPPGKSAAKIEPVEKTELAAPEAEIVEPAETVKTAQIIESSETTKPAEKVKRDGEVKAITVGKSDVVDAVKSIKTDEKINTAEEVKKDGEVNVVKKADVVKTAETQKIAEKVKRDEANKTNTVELDEVVQKAEADKAAETVGKFKSTDVVEKLQYDDSEKKER